MKVVSWNVQFGIEAELAATEILDRPELADVDVLLLQEMDERGTAVIADALGAGYAYTSAAPHAQTGRDFGNAIVARWPLRSPAEVPMPHQAGVRGHPRSATHAIVAVDGHDVSVYSVHTEVPLLSLARRIEQFAVVTADVDHVGVGEVVVGGDFNTVTSRGIRALTRTMATAGLTRVSSDSPSYRDRGRQLVLDHVFARGFDAVAAGVAPDTAASDHAPLWVELNHAPPVDAVDEHG